MKGPTRQLALPAAHAAIQGIFKIGFAVGNGGVIVRTNPDGAKVFLHEDLLGITRTGHLNHVDDVALGRSGPGNIGCAQHHLRARCASGQDNRVGVDDHGNFFARKQLSELLLERRNRLLDDQVVLDPLFARTPHDEADSAGSLSIYQNLSRPHHHRIGNRRVRQRNTRNVKLRRKDGRTPGRQRHARELSGSGRLLDGHGILRRCGRLGRAERCQHRRRQQKGQRYAPRGDSSP
jgi:hypothetical protein